MIGIFKNNEEIEFPLKRAIVKFKSLAYFENRYEKCCQIVRTTLCGILKVYCEGKYVAMELLNKQDI